MPVAGRLASGEADPPSGGIEEEKEMAMEHLGFRPVVASDGP